MICQKCGKNAATNHIHTVLNGIVKDVYLCTDCAKKYKLIQFQGGGFEAMLSELLNDGVSHKNSIRCDCCGLTLDDVKRTGRIGCSNCYNVFREFLLPTVQKLHGSTRHLGKSPLKREGNISAQPSESAESIDIIKDLKSKLQTAIADEEYELAAVLRDEIKRLEE